MPSRLIQYYQGMPPRWNCLADFLQVKRHGLRISKWQHQADSRIALRTHGTKDVGRFGLLLPHDSWSGPPTCPDPGLSAALTDTHFVLKPDIDLLELDLRRQNRLYLLGQVFF